MVMAMASSQLPPAMDSSGALVLDKLEPLVHWFESRNDAQQAAIGAALLSRANPKAAHLLHTFLQVRLQAASPIWRHEIQRANDPSFLNGLRNESRDVAVSQLLHYLPLLRPANPDAVRGYLHLLPRLLGTFLEEDHHNLNGGGASSSQQQSSELQQLLTYALVHPALSLEHKRSLAELIRQLDDNGGQEVALSLMSANSQGGLDLFQSDASADAVFHHGSNHAPLHSHMHGSGQWDPWSSRNSVLIPPPASTSSSPSLPSSSVPGQRIRRSNSLTPPCNSNLNSYLSDLWSTTEDGGGQRMKQRSQSLSSPIDNSNGVSHCSLSPQNSLGSSGSGSDSVPGAEERPSSFHVTGSGMKDVPSWLKSLRLHKYAHLFSMLNYEEMLSLTEEQLEAQGVTKGARHKIALSIQRLRERPNLIAQLEKEVVDTGTIHNALSELKNVLNTPIKPYHGPPGCGVGQDPLFHGGSSSSSLSPSPSLLLSRGDDTSGCSSLDGSTDSLVAPRIDGASDSKLNKSASVGRQSVAPSAVVGPQQSVSDMPTVIVSAAPDSDSGGEGSDTSGDDGINLNELSYSHFSCYAFNGGDVVDVMGHNPVAQEDLPGQITRLLGKICTQLLVSASPSEESVSQFITLLERCFSHEAFTQQQKRRIWSWKEQAHRIWNTLPAMGTTAGNGIPTGHAGRNNKNSDSRFARRWSNVAHYPGFYSEPNSQGSFGIQSNSYSLFPPRHPRHPHSQPRHLQGHHNTHNLYGQHTHLAAGQSPVVGSNLTGTGSAERLRPLAPAHSLPLNCSSLQVGPSHVALQHRNSFCVSALSQSLYSTTPGSPCGYSSLAGGLDPFTFHTSRMAGVDDPSTEPFTSRLGVQRARSAPMANGMSRSASTSSNNNEGGACNGVSGAYKYGSCEAEKDSSDIDLNHRLESLCLSMTEHALEGANDS